MMGFRRGSGAPVVMVALLAIAGCGGEPDPSLREDPFSVREFQVESDGRWIGNAISYGPHRDGQRPGEAGPSTAEIREDLHLMVPQWNLLRIYGSTENAEDLLKIIQEDGLDMKVMLGIWIAREELRDEAGLVTERYPEAVATNNREIEAAIHLAAAYPEIVRAVSVGNETQVHWSPHRSPPDILIKHVRRTRAAVDVPVTVADDFNFWNKPESREVAAEIDFITMHAHPLWNGVQLEDALAWLRQQVAAIQAYHPEHIVVLGETGWATTVHDQGEQARLIKGRAGESEQKEFYESVRAWAETERMPVFFFEAFDENWKGGAHPDEVEKHWGLFRADRSAKAAMIQDIAH